VCSSDLRRVLTLEGVAGVDLFLKGLLNRSVSGSDGVDGELSFRRRFSARSDRRAVSRLNQPVECG